MHQGGAIWGMWQRHGERGGKGIAPPQPSPPSSSMGYGGGRGPPDPVWDPPPSDRGSQTLLPPPPLLFPSPPPPHIPQVYVGASRGFHAPLGHAQLTNGPLGMRMRATGARGEATERSDGWEGGRGRVGIRGMVVIEGMGGIWGWLQFGGSDRKK